MDVTEVVETLMARAGGQLENLGPSSHAREVIARIEKAIAPDFGSNSPDIAFHLSDWSSDAAFLVALHLFPDEFSDEQIREGVIGFVVHAPNHAAEAGKLAGYPVEDVFSENYPSE